MSAERLRRRGEGEEVRGGGDMIVCSGGFSFYDSAL